MLKIVPQGEEVMLSSYGSLHEDSDYHKWCLSQSPHKTYTSIVIAAHITAQDHTYFVQQDFLDIHG